MQSKCVAVGFVKCFKSKIMRWTQQCMDINQTNIQTFLSVSICICNNNSFGLKKKKNNNIYNRFSWNYRYQWFVRGKSIMYWMQWIAVKIIEWHLVPLNAALPLDNLLCFFFCWVCWEMRWNRNACVIDVLVYRERDSQINHNNG